MGFFDDLFGREVDKKIIKDDNDTYKEKDYENGTKYMKIHNFDNGKHDTTIGFKTPDDRYIEGYHSENLSNFDKNDFGKTIDEYLRRK